MTAKTAEQIWAEVHAELRRLYEPFDVAFEGVLASGQVANLMRIAAVTGYQLGADDTADEFEKAIP